MKHLIAGIAAAIGLTGCTVIGHPTAASVRPDDFAVEPVIMSTSCGQYAPQAPDRCLHQVEVTVNWLPDTPSPAATVVYTVVGGEQPQSGHVTFNGAWREAHTTPWFMMVAAPTDVVLTGRVTYVTKS